MAFDMHIKFGSGKVKIEGSSKHAKHKGEVPILAWSWGASKTGDLHGGSGASGGKANVQDITVTKYVDSAPTHCWMPSAPAVASTRRGSTSPTPPASRPTSSPSS